MSAGLWRVSGPNRARCAGLAVLLGAGILSGVLLARPGPSGGQAFSAPSRSTTIALTADDQRLVVVNKETNSVSVFLVRGFAGDASDKLAEVTVGQDPRCVALSGNEAWVTNFRSGTVSVISLTNPIRVVAEIPVGTSPWGCAMTPSGRALLVADHTAGNLITIDVLARQVASTTPLGGHPAAIAITNNGDASDTDETAFVTEFFAELIPGGPGEGFDTGKQGIVHAIKLSPPFPVTRITLAPLANSGFTANRTNFCPQTAPNPAVLPSAIFCPDLAAPAGSDPIVKDPQGAFPNQLGSALIRGSRLYLPNIGAAPEPPVLFSANVQALVHVVNTATLAEVPAETLNGNIFVAQETAPAVPNQSLDRLFGNDVVAIDATLSGSDFFVVSRGGNYLARFNTATQKLSRYQTGNIPNGVVVSRDGLRAYVNNEVNVSVTVIDIPNNLVLRRDLPSGTPPEPGTFNHVVLLGKLVFFTALGIPDNGIFDTPIRDIVPLTFRGKASNSGWSSCASCHPDGLADGVTWIFPAGPRQTIPLDSSYSKFNGVDRRIILWSALRGSGGTDFNNNSRGVQGGCGFASAVVAGVDPPAQCTGANPLAAAPNPNIYDHGITVGGSDALDAMEVWLQTVAPPRQPTVITEAVARGRTIFAASCATCHGGAKWTKSTIFYRDNPAFNRDPAQGGAPIDPGVVRNGGQILSYTVEGQTLTYLENIGTFNPANPLEIRQNGILALGALGFNVPSLLGVGYHSPYLHNGAAQTLEAVYPLHNLGAGTIASSFTAQQLSDLTVFLKTIDGRTDLLRSAADDFRDAVALP